ncbi:Menaquinone via 6-amino-6-deoxyfutalosine step 2 [hydrothermal vent metagenome]|uniref:adenosylhomocysteine nucleosidase n=1 Tax=hydrothermal vent metagenome TaxID=652676 RepID=A0A1W1EKX9_9ZZZZ
MKIAIMGAMQEEIIPLLAKLDNVKETTYAKNKYYEASYKGVEVVVAYSKIGKVFASLTATILIEKFKCDRLLFSGVAGAINKDLSIGDLIVANKLCQHDLDITAFGHPAGFVPEGAVFVESDKNLIDISKDVAKTLDITLFEGIIATGDQFVSNSSRKDWIADTFGADALEMEGSSVAVVCDALDIPFFILRAISDSADDSADVDFDKFLENSAKISANFILQMIEKLVK